MTKGFITILILFLIINTSLAQSNAISLGGFKCVREAKLQASENDATSLYTIQMSHVECDEDDLDDCQDYHEGYEFVAIIQDEDPIRLQISEDSKKECTSHHLAFDGRREIETAYLEFPTTIRSESGEVYSLDDVVEIRYINEETRKTVCTLQITGSIRRNIKIFLSNIIPNIKCLDPLKTPLIADFRKTCGYGLRGELHAVNKYTVQLMNFKTTNKVFKRSASIGTMNFIAFEELQDNSKKYEIVQNYPSCMKSDFDGNIIKDLIIQLPVTIPLYRLKAFGLLYDGKVICKAEIVKNQFDMVLNRSAEHDCDSDEGPISCPTLFSIDHGALTQSLENLPGSIATYSCMPHYFLDPPNFNRTCKYDGLLDELIWSGPEEDPVCKHAQLKCEENTCKNKGVCINTPEGEPIYCKCLYPFKGRYCEHFINPCSSNPCKKGYCEVINNLKNYKCNCYKEYYGKNCDKRRKKDKTCLVIKEAGYDVSKCAHNKKIPENKCIPSCAEEFEGEPRFVCLSGQDHGYLEGCYEINHQPVKKCGTEGIDYTWDKNNNFHCTCSPGYIAKPNKICKKFTITGKYCQKINLPSPIKVDYNNDETDEGYTPGTRAHFSCKNNMIFKHEINAVCSNKGHFLFYYANGTKALKSKLKCISQSGCLIPKIKNGFLQSKYKNILPFGETIRIVCNYGSYQNITDATCKDDGSLTLHSDPCYRPTASKGRIRISYASSFNGEYRSILFAIMIYLWIAY